MNKRPAWTIGGIFVGILAFIWFRGSDPRSRAEHDHGIRLPSSAHHIQRRADGLRFSFIDHGIVTMFEMNTNDLPAFIAQLRIQSRREPIRPSGDVTRHGYNVWPDTSTFVPGNYSRFKRTWSSEAVPIEMLSCSSPAGGDWLHVELWRLEGQAMLVKMYTDWN